LIRIIAQKKLTVLSSFDIMFLYIDISALRQG
jgi:hypothetical protein